MWKSIEQVISIRVRKWLTQGGAIRYYELISSHIRPIQRVTREISRIKIEKWGVWARDKRYIERDNADKLIIQ